MSNARWWRKWLEEAIKSPPTFDDSNRAIREASSWNICAIGEKRELLEIRGVKFEDGLGPIYAAPTEINLRIFGNKFYLALKERNFKGALLILDTIDKWIATHPVIKEDKDASSKFTVSPGIQNYVDDLEEQKVHTGKM